MTENFPARAIVVSTETAYCRHGLVLGDRCWVHQAVGDHGQSVFPPASPVYAFAIAAGEGMREHGDKKAWPGVAAAYCAHCSCFSHLRKMRGPIVAIRTRRSISWLVSRPVAAMTRWVASWCKSVRKRPALRP